MKERKKEEKEKESKKKDANGDTKWIERK
jgi:hypothetical protein